MRRRSLIAGLMAAGVLLANSASAADPTLARYEDDVEDVFWFVHLSDLHVGSPINPGAADKFNHAMLNVVPTIKPIFTVVTGDLVDANITLAQNQEEWDAYKAVLSDNGITSTATYIDLPGNHDCYGDVGMTYYKANSLLFRTEASLYKQWTHKTAKGEYYFFGLNSAGNGSIPTAEDPAFTADEVTALTGGAQAHSNARLFFAFAHHLLEEPKNFAPVKDVLKNNKAFYIHGHVHEYKQYIGDDGVIVRQEVDSLGRGPGNNIALGVVDHDAFIYRATSENSPWPFVVVTAPVDKFLNDGTTPNPYVYKVCKDRKSNPVRALAFTDAPDLRVMAKFGPLASVNMTSVTGEQSGMYVAHFDTTSVPAGSYQVSVSATSGTETNTHAVRIDLVDGPCEPFEDAGAPVEAGREAGPDAPRESAPAQEAEAPQDSGPDVEASPDAGSPAPKAAAPAEDEGCSCRTGAASSGSTRWMGVLGAAMLAWAVRRRRTWA